MSEPAPDAVLTRLHEGVLTVTFNRPQKKNAFTHAMYTAATQALVDGDRDPAVRVIALTGAGSSFTAGNDLLDFLAHPPEGEAALRKFLLDPEGVYGWDPEKGKLNYDFFPDGRLHIQGPDGEATMWEGKWKLVGDQLTIISPQQKVKKTVTARREGEALVLDGVRYHRSKP